MDEEDIYDYGDGPIKNTRKKIPLYRDGAEELLQDLDDARVNAKLKKIIRSVINEWFRGIKKKFGIK